MIKLMLSRQASSHHGNIVMQAVPYILRLVLAVVEPPSSRVQGQHPAAVSSSAEVGV